MKNTVLMLGLLCLPILAFSQNYTTRKTATGKAQKAFAEGMKLKMRDDAEGALKEFTAALKADATFIDAHIQQAAVLSKLQKLPEAEAAFEKVLAIDTNYEPEVLYSLGNLEMRQDKYAEAAEHYEAYLNAPKINALDKRKAEKTARDARFAATAVKNPVPFAPKSVGEGVNDPKFSEYLPVLTADGSTMIFTRLLGRQEDFFQSKRDSNGVWQTAKSLEELNTDNSEGAQTIAADGKMLLFAAKDRAGGFGSFDIFYSKKTGEKWSIAKPFAPINTEFWESQPSISSDGRTIYFASARPNGLGGIDIWYVRFENGKWSEARNLGAPINTAEDDQTPFIHADGQTLYFTSEGHAGMGGKDLYLSRLDSAGKWQVPQNLGFPINTKDNEGTLSVSLDGKTAYYGRGMKEKEGFSYDIFSFDLHEKARPQPVTYVRATVLDAVSKTPLSKTRLEFVDLASQKLAALNETDSAGTFLVCLPFGKNYALNVSKSAYVFQSENFNLTTNASLSKPFELEFFLQKIPPTLNPQSPITEGGKVTTEKPADKPIVLKNVFFETGKADLKTESLAELNKLKLLLTENPNLRIEIRGHTDNVGSDTDNQILSEKRAKAVRDFLANQGIAANRLAYKGFGKNQPVSSNDTEGGRSANRRTEFVIF
jgi:outer membrane protein OmpA-like peptidoglycan-associated protein/tetratricopeptide (TPR) repeat protein